MLEKLEGAIKYGPSTETDKIGSNSQNKDIQKQTQHRKLNSWANMEPPPPPPEKQGIYEPRLGPISFKLHIKIMVKSQ